MKTIEERALEYAKKSGIDPNKDYFDFCQQDYIAGATEQKAIDDAKLRKLKSAWEKEAKNNSEANYKQGYKDAIEMAFKWLKARNVLTDASLRGFRKAMEK